MPLKPTEPRRAGSVTEREAVTVRFAGDSGDGMQLAGMQLTNTSALAGNDVATFPDYPAEIRAPKGTLAGVSGFQLQFAARHIFTPGDRLDALVAMNPAALKTNLGDLAERGVLIVDEDAFDAKGLRLAGFDANPLDDGSLDAYQLIRVPLTSLTREAVHDTGVGRKLAARCRNFFAMGLVYWLYGRSLAPTLRFIERRFGDDPAVAEADARALTAGWNFGETTEAIRGSYQVPAAPLPPGTYRNITGNQALAYGLLAAASLSGKTLFYGSYPITPASDILHELSRHKRFGVRTFQAEDEIAAVTSAIGAAFGGAMAVTASAGPGIALKSEGMGLAVMLELPMLILDIQRGGPSTGLPTKPEQADLLQVLFGRSGEAPLPVLAASGPADCFDVVQEAWRLATRLMTPVVVLSDAYVANSAEPWRIPERAALAPVAIAHAERPRNGDAFLPYARDELLARPWAIPGTPGLAHRVGGLEKEDGTGNVSYDPDNHEHMVRLRARKVANAAHLVAPQRVDGPPAGELLVLSWGGTHGACTEAVAAARARGHPVAHAHLRHLHPFPANLGEILARFRRVLIPELNTGQLRMLVRARYLVDAMGLNKVKGRPFTTTEILAGIEQQLASAGRASA
ncbi:MAG: 2-oxoacid:acceptor oxidoreductase subunit alpha [Gammaproteobacteria bacterium]|nr:2-oxoacid:acceptor oxidoreductase subunit alpha [Gammaproteobacteria bacterium]